MVTDRRGTAIAGSSIIHTAGLYKHYGNIRALEEIDLQIPPGVTGLIGANGAGKTTLIRLILGLIRPTYGEVSVFGTPVADDPAGLRARLGYMPEGKCLPLDQTAADFVAFAAELAGIPTSDSRRRASETLFLVGLHEERFRYLGDFSTGMQQRVKLAQSIVHDPELVLLDEPASGLDPEGRDQMLGLIGRFRRFGMNVLFSTHILDDIERTCDRVVMLDGGRLIHAGPLDPPGRDDRISVEVFDDPRSLVAALREQGAEVTVDGRVVMVTGRSDDPFLMLREALERSGSSVRRMGTSLSRLEDVLLAAARDADG